MSVAIKPNVSRRGAGELAAAVEGPSGLSAVAPRAEPLGSMPTGVALTLVHPIATGEKAALLSFLQGIGADIRGSREIAFDRLRLVHFMRWVVIDEPGNESGGLLVFESNHDGTPEDHLDELLREGGAGLHGIYRHCAGYPAAGDALAPAALAGVREFLQKGTTPNAAFHVGNWSKSAERIRLEAEVRDVIQSYLDRARGEPGFSRSTPSTLYDRLRAEVERAGLLDRLLEPQEPPPSPRNVLPWVIGAAALALPFILVGAPVLLFKEATDQPGAYGVPPEWVRELADREDFQVQNQLTHVVDVKPGFFRRWLLRAVLYVIDRLAFYEFNQGALGGITSIHFARWLFIDGGRRLLFFSNYDGSWESYLGDFVDKAHTGLTAVWSNTEGFPKTLLLAFRGATDEDRFKAWTRAHQVPTPLWYSAYPELTVRNVKENTALCAGLVNKPADEPGLRAWLAIL